MRQRLALALAAGVGLGLGGSLGWSLHRPAHGAGPAAQPKVMPHALPGAGIRDFGGLPDGSDTTPAFDRAVAWCREHNVHQLSFPAGNYAFRAPPRPIDFGLFLVGEGMAASVLEKDFDNGNFLTLTGGTGGNGGGMRDLAVLARPRRAPGNGIVLTATAHHAPHYTEFTNLWVTGAADPRGGKPGVWGNTFLIDGRAAVGELQGVRGVRLENCHLFNADVSTLYAFNAVGLQVRGGGLYQGAGKGCRLVITGGGTPGRDNCDGIYISTNLGGELNLTNCQKVVFDGTLGELNAGDTGWYCHITGVCSGRRNNGLRNSYVHLVP